MDKSIISTDKAPAAIGPYSQGVMVNGMLFTSGQLPINPEKGNFPEGIKAQTQQSLTNVKAIVEAGGLKMENVVKVTVYLKDMNDFADMNEVYAQFFGTNAPVRAAVEVARLPKDALVEIDAIAVV